MMPIALSHRLKAAQPPNRVLYTNPSLRERPIIRAVFGWAWFATRLAPGCRPQALRMQRRDAYVRQVTEATHTRRQPLQ
jgi:hypothetical protein